VGSPLRLCRFAAVLGTATVLAAAIAASADANPEADARATAIAFVDAVGRDDADRVCSLFSPDAIRRLGGTESCRASMSESEDEVDYEALESLVRGHTAARLSATKRRGQYVTKKFGARRLARDMEQLDPELTVKLARSAAAAKGQLVTTVVLDTRSTARRLVLYAESDDGSIFRLSVTSGGQPRLEEVAVGIPETSRPPSEAPKSTFSATIDSVTLDATGTAFARGTFVLSQGDETYKYGIMLVLIPLNGAYFVDDILYSSLRSDEST
jgi:hypothetical protein